MTDFITLAAENFGVSGNMKEYAGKVTLTGLMIVFAMLIVLVLIFFIFGRLMQATSGKNSKEGPKPAPAPKTPAKPDKAPAPKAPAKPDMAPAARRAEATDDGEVLAAISAAVAIMYEGTGKQPVIRSVKPAAKGVRSAWQAAGIANNTRPF